MTAEIVIMNKHGLSLAADSAITSGVDGVRKVYNSANKLFALSNDHPIGIMVYGSASFMEVPWDVILKTYQDYLGEQKFSNLQDYATHFLAFLQKEKRYNYSEVEDIIVYRIFSDILKQVIREVEETIAEKENREESIEDKTVTDLLLTCVTNHIQMYKKTQAYVDLDYSVFTRRFGNVIEEIEDEVVMYKIPKRLKEKLNELAFETVKRDYFSVGSSGFVITGYGEEEIFPRLLNYRLEGFVLNQLKYKKKESKMISYTADSHDGTASISAFGQREMVDSFVSGIEPNIEEAIFGIIDKVFNNYHHQMQELLGITLTKEQVRKMQIMGNTIYESIEDSFEEYKVNSHLEPLLGVIRSLPVKELAEMTETLINLTSFKRRVTRVTESVGPPIDVAVITKSAGFVWVKKKSIVKNYN